MITLRLKYFSVPIICTNLFTISPGLFPCIQSMSVHYSSLSYSEMLSKYMHLQNDFWQYSLSYRSLFSLIIKLMIPRSPFARSFQSARSSTSTNERCQQNSRNSHSNNLIKQFSASAQITT
ncbi:Hypothetical_protein [Hexamita inflata]|uniref:Hypothetical_protein n=1 Tax=Hexamita inflata TaxID=28002 RepID=A0ABP1I7N8_9EUKA